MRAGSSRMASDININLYNSLFEDATKRQRTSAPTSELGQYMATNFLITLRPKSLQPLDIWLGGKKGNPILILSAMARDLLTVQASTVASRMRIFLLAVDPIRIVLRQILRANSEKFHLFQTHDLGIVVVLVKGIVVGFVVVLEIHDDGVGGFDEEDELWFLTPRRLKGIFHKGVDWREHSDPGCLLVQAIVHSTRNSSGNSPGPEEHHLEMVFMHAKTGSNEPYLPRSNIKLQKVFEDESSGVVCYKDDKGEIICEAYDEGPRLEQQHWFSKFSSYQRDGEAIVGRLKRSLLLVIDGAGKVN
ncbi:choline transporter-like protein 2 [Tanacetum coccineum]